MEPSWDVSFQDTLTTYVHVDGEGGIDPSRSLFDLGLDSTAVIQLMIDIEGLFGITFPDELLTAETFETASSLWSVVTSLRTGSTG
jgi:acyl carrier protein